MFEWWARVSARERRLGVLAAILVGISLGYLAYVQATDRLATMDATIDGLEYDLEYYTEQMQVLEEVDRAYAAVASEHSSKWTQEEIHDRLRREIARLSLMDPPAPGAQVSLTGGGTRLVDIRQMPQGSLSSSDAGYREYQITIRTQPTAIQNVTAFLERLHKSPQALRIASLELTRPPANNTVTARINVIRTVIDTEMAGPARAASEPSKNWILNSGFEDWQNEQTPSTWVGERATFASDAGIALEGERGTRVTANEAGAMFYQTVELSAGRTYRLEFAIRTTGPVQVRAYDESSGAFVGDPVIVGAKPVVQRYRVRLKAPGPAGTPVAIRAPVFVIDNAGDQIALDEVVLNEIGA